MLVLQTLSVQPLHGYAIAQQIEALSDDVLRVEQGSLYPALERLQKKGWITSQVGRVAHRATRPLLHAHRRRPPPARRRDLELRRVLVAINRVLRALSVRRTRHVAPRFAPLSTARAHALARSTRRELAEEIDFLVGLEALQREHAARGDAVGRERARRGAPAFRQSHLLSRGRAPHVWPRAFDTLAQDVRFALRTFVAPPGFTAVAVLTLAIGIGANTAIFSAVDTLLLRRCRFASPSG